MNTDLGRRRTGRINVRALVILAIIVVVGGGGAAGAYKFRKRVLAERALQTARDANGRADYTQAVQQYRVYLSKYPDDVEVLRECAQAAIAQRPPNRPAAIGAYRRLLHVRADDHEAMHKLTRLYFDGMQFNDAAYICRRRLESDADDVDASVWLAKTLLVTGRPGEAREALAPVVAAHPEMVEGYAQLAAAEVALRAAGDPSATDPLAVLSECVERNPAAPRAYVQRAQYYRSILGELDEARDDLEKAERLSPTDPLLLLAMAGEWLVHDPRRAAKWLDEAEQRASDLPPDAAVDAEEFALLRWSTASRLALRQGDRERCGRIADEALERLVGDLRVVFLPVGVDLYLAARRVESAEQAAAEYERVVTQRLGGGGRVAGAGDPAAASARRQIALLSAAVADARNDWRKVIALLEDLVVTQPDTHAAWRLLWRAYDRVGQGRRAETALLRALAGNPDDAQLGLALARRLRHRNWGEVRRWSDRVLRRDPDHLEATLLRTEASAELAKANGDTTGAVALLGEIAALKDRAPQDVDVRLVEGNLAWRLGDRERAFAVLRQGLKECTNTLPLAIRLSALLVEDGRSDEATELCRWLVAQYPSSAMARLGLAELVERAGDAGEAERLRMQAVTALEGDERSAAVYALARNHLARDQVDRAMKLLQELAVERPRDVTPRLALLEIPQVRQDEDLAAALIEEVRRIEGEHGLQWRLERARFRLRTDNWQEHFAEVEELLRLCMSGDPGWSAPVITLAAMYESRGQVDRCEEILRRGFDASPESQLETVGRLLMLLENQQRYGDVRTLLQRLPRNDSTRRLLEAHTVALAVGEGNLPGALEQLRKIVEANPENAPLRITLAELMYGADPDALDEALRQLHEARGLDPTLRAVTLSEAQILARAGRGDEARGLLDREVEHHKDAASYLMRARLRELLGAPGEAEADYREAITRSGGGADAHNALTQFLTRQNRPADALAAAEQGLTVDPQHTQLQRAMVELLSRQPEPALRARGRTLLDRLLEATPNDAGLLYARGVLELSDGDSAAQSRGRADLEQAVRIDPRHVRAQVRLAAALSEEGRLDEAAAQVARALEANPADTELLVVKAGLEADLGRPAVARELGENLLRSQPDHVGLLNLLARLALDRGDVAEAKRHSIRAVELDATSEHAHLVRAEILAKQGALAEAIALLETYRNTPAGGERTSVLLALATLHSAGGNFERAGTCLDQAQEQDPASTSLVEARTRWLGAQGRFSEIVALVTGQRGPEGSAAPSRLLVSAGTILLSSRDPAYIEEATRWFETVLGTAPTSIPARLGVARAAYLTGDVEGAAKHYRSVLELKPDEYEALNDLAWILGVDLNRPSEALPYADRGITVRPDDPSLLDTRGVILLRLNRLREARESLERCVDIGGIAPTTRAIALVHLGEVLQTMDDGAGARMRLESALRLDDKQTVLDAATRQKAESLLANLPR
jgi:tetratricopeptide (TPR) repeat protein